MMRKNGVLEKEARKKESIEDEIRSKKKEHGQLTRELAKIDQGIKETVSLIRMFAILQYCNRKFNILDICSKNISYVKIFLLIFIGSGFEQKTTSIHQSQREDLTYEQKT